MESIDHFSYTPDPVPEDVQGAAEDAAAQCGYDQFEEVLLGQTVMAVRRVSADSVRALFPDVLEAPYSVKADEVVRIDWVTWAMPKKFDGRYEDAVIARSESIVVDTSTLLRREVFTYGLGPEYNWLAREEGIPPTGELPEFVFEAIGQLITEDWREQVCEYADDDSKYLDQIHPKLRSAVAEAMSDGGAQS
jgi:hypothetical protein